MLSDPYPLLCGVDPLQPTRATLPPRCRLTRGRARPALGLSPSEGAGGNLTTATGVLLRCGDHNLFSTRRAYFKLLFSSSFRFTEEGADGTGSSRSPPHPHSVLSRTSPTLAKGPVWIHCYRLSAGFRQGSSRNAGSVGVNGCPFTAFKILSAPQVCPFLPPAPETSEFVPSP